MTPNPNPMPEKWRLQLLAYVDNELAEQERLQVDIRLANDPAARELLYELEALCPSQRELWRSVGPRTPSSGSWERVRVHLSDFLPQLPAKKVSSQSVLRRWLFPISTVVVAASVLLVFIMARDDRAPKPAVQLQFAKAFEVAPLPHSAPDPMVLLAEYDVLPIANSMDVMISEVRGNVPPGLVSCDHPIPGTLVLVTADDVVVEDDPESDWNVTRLTPGDSPIMMGTKGNR